jgi:hypothetical protein
MAAASMFIRRDWARFFVALEALLGFITGESWCSKRYWGLLYIWLWTSGCTKRVLEEATAF